MKVQRSWRIITGDGEERRTCGIGRRGYRTFFRGISGTMVFLDGVRIK